MAITKTPNKDLNVIDIDDLNWGPPTNENAQELDQILGTPTTIAAVGGTTTLTAAQLQFMAIRFTGALGSNAIYRIPTGASGQFIIRNSTTGAFSLSIAHQAGGSSLEIPQGKQIAIYASTLAGMGGVTPVDTPIASSTSDGEVLYNSSGEIDGDAGFTYSPSGGLLATRETSGTGTVSSVLTLNRQSSGTPSVGIGAAVAFDVETAVGVTTAAGSIRAVSTNIGAGSESFKMDFVLINNGSNNTAFTINADGSISGDSIAGAWIATQAEAEAGSNNDQIMTPLRTKQAINKVVKSSTSGNLAITSGGFVSFTHGLGEAPTATFIKLVCTTADAGFSVGDTVFPGNNNSSDTSSGSSDRFNTVFINDGNTTTVGVRFSDDANCFVVGNKSTGGVAYLNNSSWKLRITAVLLP